MHAELLVDLERYPLDNPQARERIVAAARADMAASGSAVLPGFLRPEAVRAMVAEAAALIPVSHRRDRMLSAYERAATAGTDETHPLRRASPYLMRVTATDQMDPAGPTLAVYEWDALTRLVGDILELPALYRVADPLMRCNFTILGDGDEHGWHFDGNDFVVSLLLQAPESGGAFEFAPGVRDETDENFATVKAIMDGAPGLTRLQSVEPGTLVLFRGKRALHRVTRVSGPRPRIIALFSYDEAPGMVWDAAIQRRVFGRAAGEAPVP
jgi:hypothetical protein